MASTQLFRIGIPASATALGTILWHDHYADEGKKRAIKAYSAFGKPILHYRYLEWKNKSISPVSNEEWENVDKIYAAPTVDRLGELQGMYAKYGQTAAGMTNTFGDAWITELRRLENSLPPKSVETVYKTIEEETGKEVHETFSYFDPIPLGCASIGQVHRAILKKDGREVAVKVQYHNAQELFLNDIDTIRSFCEILAPEQIVTLDALEKQNRLELDYVNEANNLIEITSNMKRQGLFPNHVVVPQPVKELCTKRLLVMDLIPGSKLIDGIQAYYSKWAEENGTTLKQLEADAKEKIEKEGIPAKYDGPSASQMDKYIKWLRLKNVVINSGITVYNQTLARKQPIPYRETILPPNIPRIIDMLMQVHGKQLLVDGVFNADPHGGNFLLLPDGRIGLIDYGATKRLTENERITACVLYAALARGDKEILCDMCDIGGYRSKYGNKEVLYKLMQFGYDSWGNDVTEGKNVQQFIDDLKKTDPWEAVPDNFGKFLSRVIQFHFLL